MVFRCPLSINCPEVERKDSCGLGTLLPGMLPSGIDGASGKWTPSILQDESGFIFLGFMPLSVCGISSKYKAEDDSFKIPPGTIQTGIYQY